MNVATVEKLSSPLYRIFLATMALIGHGADLRQGDMVHTKQIRNINLCPVTGR